MEITMDALSEEKVVEALIQNTPIAYIVLDEDYRIHFLNDSFLRLRNLEKDKTLGEKCYNISNKGVPCEQCAVRVALESKETELVCRKDILPDGRTRYLDDHAIPMPLSNNGHSYVLEIMIDRSSVMSARSKRHEALNEILETLIELLESKDEYTAQHSRNVHRYSTCIAKQLGLNDREIQEIAISGLLHDIGKVEVPYSIINKPSYLDDEEYAIIKVHPGAGDEMLNGLSQFDSVRNNIRHHHERIDGRGYPDSVGGEGLSLGAKILAVADTYDAMTTDRPYRKALTHEQAVAELERVAGTQLDKELVDCFIDLDFSVHDVDSPHAGSAKAEIERRLESPTVVTENLSEVQLHLDYRSNIDEGVFLKAIFDNTPCGYALLDAEGAYQFASDYYLEYMGLEEEGLRGSVYEGDTPAQSIASKKTIVSIEEACIKGTPKAFELYAIPVLDDDGDVGNLILCIIDRTEEIQLEKSFESDFFQVIQLIKTLLQRRLEDEQYHEELDFLEKRLVELQQKSSIFG